MRAFERLLEGQHKELAMREALIVLWIISIAAVLGLSARAGTADPGGVQPGCTKNCN